VVNEVNPNIEYLFHPMGTNIVSSSSPQLVGVRCAHANLHSSELYATVLPNCDC
jgi:hypothetical protein